MVHLLYHLPVVIQIGDLGYGETIHQYSSKGIYPFFVISITLMAEGGHDKDTNLFCKKGEMWRNPYLPFVKYLPHAVNMFPDRGTCLVLIGQDIYTVK